MSVPKLRFKDENGQDFPDLEVKKLEEIANVERGKFSVRPRNDPKYFGGNIPFVQTGDIVSSDLYLTKFSQTLNEDGLKVSRLFPKDTILVTIAANIGDTTITSFEVACTDSVVAIQALQNCAVPVWLKYAIDTKKEELDSKATQNAQRNINLQVLRPLIFNTPTVQEQSKIANFLIAVDEKISQLMQKCELLARYKKGVMQQVFSQELRFKDDGDGDFPDWQKDSLLNVSESGFTNGVFNDPSKVGSGYKLINVLDMYIDSTIDDTKLNLVELSEDEFNRNKVKYGDTFFTRSSLVKEGIAHSNVYLGRSEDVTFDGHLIRMSPKKDLINPMFFYYLLKNPQIRRQFVTRGKTTTMTTIGQADIATVILNFPSIKEQTKIADFLTSIDEKITEAQIYLDIVKQYKQGLLQQMFV
ncbi:restriction endonuclease subunit S [Pseudanabaena sp. UWO310]|uniref:restriction endonuclease subunit S n=1 Tax=Pseudanabaena sp. UWO310 TaxID=2480795 RepID=UPI001158E0CB|nr:restriction endonuclease subunit S [Pseudanabaena sp. UWO310]TYQ31614.1 restriction endonuclease subunit S [Pseudanabaena sp. UWO310]